MERNHRIAIQGVVTSVKMAKTIVVTVSTERNDPLYQKRVGYSKKFYAHDEKEVAKLGDTVTIMACRPMSKLKRFRLVSVDILAKTKEKAEAVEERLEASEGSQEALETKEAE